MDVHAELAPKTPFGFKAKYVASPLLRSSVTGNYLDRDEYYAEYAKGGARLEDGRPPLPLSYTRRVEGLIRPVDMARYKMEDLEAPSEQKPIARLAHGLDRVLFKCVYSLAVFDHERDN